MRHCCSSGAVTFDLRNRSTAAESSAVSRMPGDEEHHQSPGPPGSICRLNLDESGKYRQIVSPNIYQLYVRGLWRGGAGGGASICCLPGVSYCAHPPWPCKPQHPSPCSDDPSVRCLTEIPIQRFTPSKL